MKYNKASVECCLLAFDAKKCTLYVFFLYRLLKNVLLLFNYYYSSASKLNVKIHTIFWYYFASNCHYQHADLENDHYDHFKKSIGGAYHTFLFLYWNSSENQWSLPLSVSMPQLHVWQLLLNVDTFIHLLIYYILQILTILSCRMTWPKPSWNGVSPKSVVQCNSACWTLFVIFETFLTHIFKFRLFRK